MIGHCCSRYRRTRDHLRPPKPEASDRTCAKRPSFPHTIDLGAKANPADQGRELRQLRSRLLFYPAPQWPAPESTKWVRRYTLTRNAPTADLSGRLLPITRNDACVEPTSPATFCARKVPGLVARERPREYVGVHVSAGQNHCHSPALHSLPFLGVEQFERVASYAGK